MLTLSRRTGPYCDGIARRELLVAGALGLGGITLADLLRAEATAPAAGRRPKSVIYIVLGGGPSHIDMWDLKPEAPAEIRGPFRPIDTCLPGVRICEHMPRQAAMLDQFALIRGVRSVEFDHYLSEVYTGLPRTAGKRPAFGSIVSRLKGGDAALPAYVALNEETVDPFEYERPYYAGSAHAPFRPFGEALNDMSPPESLARLDDRRGLLAGLDARRRALDAQADYGGHDAFAAQALSILASPQVREAFDLSREPEENTARYGRGKYAYPPTGNDPIYEWEARTFVLARRLVEAGVRAVTLRVGSWDQHSGFSGSIFASLQTLMPLLDASVCALVGDLKERGLDQDVLVVVLGEFGRTPKISYPGPGREHWAEAGCVLFAGGGLRMGQVIGETDSRAERATEGQIGLQNVMATIYRTLGVDPATTLVDFNGRPQYVLEDGTPIAGLGVPEA
jgi:hypothetical protein